MNVTPMEVTDPKLYVLLLILYHFIAPIQILLLFNLQEAISSTSHSSHISSVPTCTVRHIISKAQAVRMDSTNSTVVTWELENLHMQLFFGFFFIRKLLVTTRAGIFTLIQGIPLGIGLEKSAITPRLGNPS